MVTGEPAYLVLLGLMKAGDLPNLAPLIDRPAWHRRAACRGQSHLFFLERGQSSAPAKAICATCPVVVQCHAAGLEGDEVGVWGGTSSVERRRTRAA